MSYKKWIIEDVDKKAASDISEKLNIDPFLSYLLAARGITDEAEISDFLSGSIRLADPMSFTDMDKAVSRIEKAVDSGEKICVYGDYDCDGVTAAALLYTFLEGMGADVFYYIPHRLIDGYGMNNDALDRIHEKGASLIVTVDNGISAVDEAQYLYSLGMELVVTDHHRLPEKLPRAEAIVNPHRDEQRLVFCDYAGVGVAFKLACALYGGDPDDLLGQYADLVAIGTVGDVVPLVSENRCLVRAGLELINNNSCCGIAALKSRACSPDKKLNADAVAFQLCPRINAAGRMGSASAAMELMLADDAQTAEYYADILCDANTQRHETENKIDRDIKNIIGNAPELVNDRVAVIDGRDYHKGVIGICAARIAEQYGKPSVIISVADGIGTASARSIEGFDIFDALCACSDLLLHYGGHPLAAGFSLKEKNISAFRERINAYAAEHYAVMPVQSLHIDCKLSPFYLTAELADCISALEPFGACNAYPVFGIYNMTLRSVTPMGDGSHIRLEAVKKGKGFRIAMFNKTVRDFPYIPGENIDIAVKLTKNYYNGRYYPSIRAVDVRKSGSDFDKYFFEKSDVQSFLLGNKNETQVYPNRDACAEIYKFLTKNAAVRFDTDSLYFALGQSLTYGQVCFALDAFEEVGLISRDDGVSLNSFSGKADLENTKVLAALRERTCL